MTMRSDRLWVISLTFAVGCGSSDGGPSIAVAGGSSSSGGFSGSAPTSGAAGALATSGSSQGGLNGAAPTGGVTAAVPGGASTTGGLLNGSVGGSSSDGGTGGTAAGGWSTNGGAGGSSARGGSAGRSMGGGTSGGQGAGGRGAGAPSNSGGGASKAGAGSSGTPATGGTGGCVQNIGCKLQPPPSSGDLHQDCVDRINQFRTQCACLPPLQRRTDGEACANQMAEYDAGKNTAHAGSRDKICQPGGAQNECPAYSSNNQVISLCMQQMWDEGPPPMNPCEGDCFQEYGHFINMTSTSTTKVACGFYTTSAGKVWAVQNFSR